MAVAHDKYWAKQYILDPLNDAEAWQETGFYQEPPHPKISSTSTPPRSTHGRPRLASPLEKVKREDRRANRASHPRWSNIPAPDIIDRLDNVLDGIPYHHEGPFDATLRARQIPGRSPVEALARSNAEALAATPRANIMDSLEKHRPLQGTASVPPGMRAPGGDTMPEYDEYDVMTRDGNYKRHPGLNYLDEDLKGKGNPGYTLDKFGEQQKAARKARRGISGQDSYKQPEPKNGAKVLAYEPVSTEGPRSGKRLGSSIRRKESFGEKLRRKFSIRRIFNKAK